MPTRIDVRESTAEDFAAIEALYPKAFPVEDLLPLLKKLWRAREEVFSMLAAVDGALAGHACFTDCGIGEGDAKLSMLGPIAVEPSLQRSGIGSALIEEGFRRLTQAGAERVLVLGDPAYYGRFGFAPEADIAPPYALPEEWREAWQSVVLNEAAPRRQGKLVVPPPWRDKTLWLP